MIRYLMPWTLVKEVRQWCLETMTPASVVGFLGIIASLNAIWSYPLNGLLIAIVSLLCVAAVVCWMFRPRIIADLRLPEMIGSGETGSYTLTIINQSSFPVFDLAMSWTDLPADWRTESFPVVRELGPHQSREISGLVRFGARGEKPWPGIYVESPFPFAIYRSHQRISRRDASGRSWGSTLVTPLKSPTNLTNEIGNLMTRGRSNGGHRAGDSRDYVGSREYVYGDAVRSWDFASWARMGRPIVRQFEEPTTEDLTIIVDAFGEGESHEENRRAFERRLSLTVSILDWVKPHEGWCHLILPQRDAMISLKVKNNLCRRLLRPLALSELWDLSPSKGYHSRRHRAQDGRSWLSHGRVNSGSENDKAGKSDNRSIQEIWDWMLGEVSKANPCICVFSAKAMQHELEQNQFTKYRCDLLSRLRASGTPVQLLTDDPLDVGGNMKDLQRA